MRIALEIQRLRDLSAPPRRRLVLSRLLARVQFRLSRGAWSEPHPALIDTGAPYSLLPSSLWSALRIDRLQETSIRGIVPGEAAEMDAILAKVAARMLGANVASPPFQLTAMLANTDLLPVIIGWSGCLDRAKPVVDTPHDSAYLEF